MKSSVTWSFENWLGLKPVWASTWALTMPSGRLKSSTAQLRVTSVMTADQSGAVTSSDASAGLPGEC